MCRRATSLRPRIRPRAARSRSGYSPGGFDRPSPLRYSCAREERWPSGRRRTPGKCVTPNRVRGFESHPLRHNVCEDDSVLSFKLNLHFSGWSGVRTRVRQNRRERFWTHAVRPQGEGREARVNPTLSAIMFARMIVFYPPPKFMVARVCIFATTGHEPRQARKGAAVEALSRAPKSCWRGPPPRRRATISRMAS